jgi:hypothetical protein
MVVLFDDHLRYSGGLDSRTRYLLELLGDGSIEAFLYSDAGPPADTIRAINMDNGVEAPLGWVEIGPGTQDRLRLIKRTQDGKPVERITTVEDSAYWRVLNAEKPQEYELCGNADARRLADAHAMLAAKAIQADLFVTDRALPFALGRDEWTPVTLMRPEDAIPVVALFLRRQHRFLLAHTPALGNPNQPVSEISRDRNYFYWEAAGLLLTDSWRWRIACDTHARATGDENPSLLRTAVVHRLSQVLRLRDRLLASTSVTQNMDTADDILNDLDMILVFLMAAFDSLARVCNFVLRIPRNYRQAGWQSGDWIELVAERNQALADLFADGTPGRALMVLLSKLRNNIHGQALSATGLVPVVGDYALETFMALPADDRDEILGAIDRLGGLEVWGLATPLASYELHLQPGVFNERLIPQAIRLMNQIMMTTPVETLEGIEHPENLTSDPPMPLSLPSKRLILQLGLDSPVVPS